MSPRSRGDVSHESKGDAVNAQTWQSRTHIWAFAHGTRAPAPTVMTAFGRVRSKLYWITFGVITGHHNSVYHILPACIPQVWLGGRCFASVATSKLIEYNWWPWWHMATGARRGVIRGECRERSVGVRLTRGRGCRRGQRPDPGWAARGRPRPRSNGGDRRGHRGDAAKLGRGARWSLGREGTGCRSAG